MTNTTYAERFKALAQLPKPCPNPNHSESPPGVSCCGCSGGVVWAFPTLGTDCSAKPAGCVHDDCRLADARREHAAHCDECGGSGRVPIPYGMGAVGAMLETLGLPRATWMIVFLPSGKVVISPYQLSSWEERVKRTSVGPDLPAALIAALEHITEEQG